MNLILTVTKGSDRQRKVWVRAGNRCLVGRTQRSDVSFPSDQSMSTVHFELSNGPTECSVVDRGSTNGTFLNGKRIENAVLQHGDVLRAGDTEFLVALDGHRRGNTVVSAPNEVLLKSDLSSARASSREGERVQESVTLVKAKEIFPKDLATPTSAGNVSRRIEVGPAARLQTEDVALLWGILPWENARGEGRLSVIVKATLLLDPNPQLADKPLPLWAADEPFDKDNPSLVRLESDFVPFKPRADILVVGHAYAPQQRPVTQLDATVRVGTTAKTIRVFGDRAWSFPTLAQMVPRMSSPVPFTKMELSYARAFGGIDEHAARYCAENLAGVGLLGELSVKSIHGKPVPNFEDPARPIVDWESRPQPQGFGFYGRGWMPRLKYAGTFDENYVKNRSPLPPEDASHEVHNSAHPDLQVSGYLRGDERFELINLSPRGDIRGTLPGLRPKVHVTHMRRDENEVRAEDEVVTPNLDTLLFLPDEGLLCLVYRTVFAIPSLDEIDISSIRISC